MSQALFANEYNYNHMFSHPVYLGVLAGYGSTLWDGLVPPRSKQNEAVMISAPTEAQEGGGVWGFYAGYEIIPFFAIEANYIHYPNAKVCFAEDSLFAFMHETRTRFITKTEKVSLLGKFMILLPRDTMRAFAEVGAAGIHRSDEVKVRWRVGPTFGIGLSYNFTPHGLAEFGIDYTSGYGVSELDPANDYIPFLLSGSFRLAYRF